MNFAKRSCCNRCGKGKIFQLYLFYYLKIFTYYLTSERGECPKKKKVGQEIGKVAAEKSRGLFR